MCDATWVPMTSAMAEVQVTQEGELELRRLGDEIAELASHLNAATARLLNLSRTTLIDKLHRLGVTDTTAA